MTCKICKTNSAPQPTTVRVHFAEGDFDVQIHVCPACQVTRNEDVKVAARAEV